MVNSYRFFANRECEYYPCHKDICSKDIEDMNCLFCYCPLYMLEKCPGNPQYIESNGKRIKACTDCTFPHKAENYDIIMGLLKNI